MKKLSLSDDIRYFLPLCCLLVSAVGCHSGAGQWSSGRSPLEVGTLAAGYTVEHLLGSIDYANVCCAYGVLKFAGVTGDEALSRQVETAYADYLSGEKRDVRNNWQGAGVVAQWFGFVPFELFEQTGNSEYLLLGRQFAGEQFANPRSDGLPGYTRFWVDDMFGIGLLQGQACKYLGQSKYADRGLHSLLVHAGKLQQPNGLFHHAADNAPFFWGRGNGWAAAGMAELLLHLPKEYPKREQLLRVYRNQMKGLIRYQDADGAWRQLIDYRNSWHETSCTAMFVFAIATGVTQGWLPTRPYRQAAERGWLALTDYVDPRGRLKETCIGTGKRSSAAKYLGRPRAVGDPHGQGPLLWAATAMIRMDSNTSHSLEKRSDSGRNKARVRTQGTTD
ncbi:MAG: glycoside hydrolase family 88/105 protein [Planctomycetota bacterium]|jgi:rhamnogalacturonyl hydrolase YesR